MKTVLKGERHQLEAFRCLLERFVRLLDTEGIQMTPFRPDRAPYFERLPSAEQLVVLESFGRYVEVCDELKASGGLLGEDGSFLWRMLHRLGARPLSDLMSLIEPGDIIEIYDARYVQIFRNLAFFSRCSYTLDELLCRPFWELFRREERVTQKLFEVGQAMFRNELTATHRWCLGAHTVDEIDSQSLYHSVVENRIVSPLFGPDGQIIAVVSTIRSLSCVPTARSQGRAARIEEGAEVEADEGQRCRD